VSNTGDWAEASVSVVQVTKYYHFGGQRIAMRQGDVVYYLHGDHLGSTSLATTAAGALHSRQGYYPYGETRYTAGELPTDFGFTGQRDDSYIKLIQMGARWYDAQLGRWISADTLVPNPANPQDFNRYTYVSNNPLRYTDPTGHCASGDTACIEARELLYGRYGWSTKGTWSLDEVQTLLEAAGMIEQWFAQNGGGNAQARMRAAFGKVKFKHSGFLLGSHHVQGHTVYLVGSFSRDYVLHEMGHVLDNSFGTEFAALFGGGPSDDMSRDLGGEPEACIT